MHFSHPVEEILAKLVAFPTISDRPVVGIAAYLAERLEGLGFSIELIEGIEKGKCNLVARYGPVNTDGLVLSGHMDVVPVAGQPWSSDPFVLTRQGDRLIGRGSCDMKAFLAATVEGLKGIELSKLKRELVLIFTHDEEVGCLGSRSLVKRYHAEGRVLPRACWIGEPTGFNMFRMHPGHTALRIVCGGKAAHSSKPELGENAILSAGRVISLLEKIAAEWRQEVRFAELLERPFVVMNVAQILGGVAVNVVPDRCVIDVGFRQLPGMSAEALFQQLSERIQALSRTEAPIQTELVRITPSLCTPEGSCLEEHLRPWAVSPRPTAAAFATDGGNFEQLGLQTIVFGPGSIDVAHQANEYVPVDELHRTLPMIQAMVQKFCM
jgi:acetylornithine deacetylase